MGDAFEGHAGSVDCKHVARTHNIHFRACGEQAARAHPFISLDPAEPAMDRHELLLSPAWSRRADIIVDEAGAPPLKMQGCIDRGRWLRYIIAGRVVSYIGAQPESKKPLK